MKVIGSRSRL